jgi:uncharacterized membrane protein
MTVSDQIIQVLDALCEKFGIAIDWTSANIVPYVAVLCTKLVNYEIWTSVAGMAIAVVLSIIGIILVVALREKMRNAMDNYDAWPFLLYAVVACVWLATIIILCFETMDIIKCVTFPEMYVFEYVKGVISAKS